MIAKCSCWCVLRVIAWILNGDWKGRPFGKNYTWLYLEREDGAEEAVESLSFGGEPQVPSIRSGETAPLDRKQWLSVVPEASFIQVQVTNEEVSWFSVALHSSLWWLLSDRARPMHHDAMQIASSWYYVAITHSMTVCCNVILPQRFVFCFWIP